MRAPVYRVIILLLTLFIGACANMHQHAPSPQYLNAKGNEAYYKRDYSDALRWYSVSLKESQKLGDKQFYAISMYGLGRANGRLCNFDEAESWLVKSIDARKSLPNLGIARRSQNIFELGRLYMAQGKWVEAKEQFTHGLPMLEGLDMEGLNIEKIDPLGYANFLEEYQKILLNTGNDKEASTNQIKIDQLRENNQDGNAQYISDLYTTNCTPNKSSKKEAKIRDSSCLSVSSCGSVLNTFYDEHQNFIHARNKALWDNVDYVLRYWDRKENQRYMDIILIDETILEYRFDTPQCAWSYFVNKHTQEIQSWKFLSDDTSGCRLKKFYEGP